MASGLCVHPEGGVAYDRVRLVLWAGCDQDRLTLNFLAHGKDTLSVVRYRLLKFV